MKFFAMRGDDRRASSRRRARRSLPLSVDGLESRQMLAAGPVGINIDSLQFVDLMKEAGNWGALGSTPLTEDAKGWPTSDAMINVLDWRVNQPFNGPDPNAVSPDIGGTYRLSFQGRALISPDFPQNYTVQNQVYNAATNTTTADLAVVHNSFPFLDIDFAYTYNPASSTGAGVTNVQLLRPGYATGSTQLFTNDVLNALKPFGTIRYLNIDGANSYGPTLGSNGLLAPLNWSQRTLPDARSQTTLWNAEPGEAWEYQVALANASNTDMWINIPGPATNDYVTQLANLIKNGDAVDGVYYPGLNPNLKVYVEYSNEVWGGIAAPTNYNTEATREEIAAGGSVLNNDGDANLSDLSGRRYMERSAQIATLFGNVFGSDPTHSRIRPMLAWQENNTSYFTQTLPWFESTFTAPSAYFYGMGDAIYWDPTDYSSANAIISTLAAGEAQTYTSDVLFTAISHYYGLKNVAYEGGPEIGAAAGTAAGQNALAASRDPRMEALVEQHYLDWYAAGGDLANYYDGPYNTWSPQYEWDAAELAQASNPSLSAKYRGIADIATAATPAITAGFAVSPTLLTSLPVGADSLGLSFATAYTGQTDVWLVNVATAGSYTLSMATASNGSGSYQPGTVEVLLGDQTILGTYRVSQSGTLSLGAVSLPAGLSTLAIKVIHGANDPSSSNPTIYLFQPTSLTLTPPGYVPPPPPPPDPNSFPVPDGSFENQSIGYGAFVYNPTGSTWSFVGGSGLAANASSFTLHGAPAPLGTQAAFLQSTGSFSEAAAGWTAGSYTLSFDATQRANNGISREDFQVLIDGVVVATETPSSGPYQLLTTPSFAVTAGTHTITYKGLDTVGGDNTALIDAVSGELISPAAPAVGDAGFESHSVGLGGYSYDPTGSPWAFAGTSGLTSNGSAFTSANPSAPQGTQVAFLQSNGSFSQAVANWAAGSYAISFGAAQRANIGTSLEDFQVLVDGVVVATFLTQGGAYVPCTTASFAVTAGSHTITFKGLDTAGGDNTALIDAVSIAASTSTTQTPAAPSGTSTSSAPAVGDAGFESHSVGLGGYSYDPTGSPWAFAGTSGLTSNGSAFTSANPSAPQGTQVAFLQSNGSFSQAVANWAAGSYAISFGAAQRANIGTSLEDFQVLVDGVVVATFLTQGGAYVPCTTASFAVTAGSHTITFKGLDTAGGDNTALIDAVSIAASTSTTQTPAAPSGTSTSSAPAVGDAGFESHSVGLGGYSYDPTGSPWAFAGTSGLTSNGSAFTSANPSAPQGTQVAFLQSNGSFSQAVANWAAGSYTLSLDIAQRANDGTSLEDIAILIDGVVIAMGTPPSTSYLAFTTASFTVGAGTHTITFKGLDTVGGDNTVLIDAIGLTKVS